MTDKTPSKAPWMSVGSGNPFYFSKCFLKPVDFEVDKVEDDQIFLKHKVDGRILFIDGSVLHLLAPRDHLYYVKTEAVILENHKYGGLHFLPIGETGIFHGPTEIHIKEPTGFQTLSPGDEIVITIGSCDTVTPFEPDKYRLVFETRIITQLHDIKEHPKKPKKGDGPKDGSTKDV